MNQEFACETDYNIKAFAAMAKALRKTIRKKKSRRAHIFGWIVAVLGIASLAAWEVNRVTLAALIVLIPFLLFEDWINGFVGKKKNLPGAEHCSCRFYPDRFIAVTGIGKTEFGYDRIQYVTEDAGYFVFIINEKRAQAYDKKKLTGGTCAEFRKWIEERTGLSVVSLSGRL